MVKILAVVFGILTIFGGVYVLATCGQANSGYAVIPMVFCLAFSTLARNKPKDK